ncbi:MAG TPA: RNA 2',3'-cyclic phosphodiesterase [Anaerolineaceae bacterium]|nr:RNA 2',3'-cyclic phosphodiesterase [Anaerolineaceae bacterium]
METIRAFIAIELPPSIQRKLGEVINGLKSKKTDIIRWVPPYNIHITLKFLGDVSTSGLPVLTHIVESEVSRYRPFEITVGGIGAFPNLRQPRVVWIGVQAPPILGTIQRSLEAEIRRMGYVAEDKPFSPHLTIGRMSHNATQEDIHQISVLLSNTHVEELGSVTVDSVRLFKSDLKPGGAVYTAIANAEFSR